MGGAAPNKHDSFAEHSGWFTKGEVSTSVTSMTWSWTRRWFVSFAAWMSFDPSWPRWDEAEFYWCSFPLNQPEFVLFRASLTSKSLSRLPVFLSITNKSQFFKFGHNFVFRVPAVFRRNKLEKFLNYVRLRPWWTRLKLYESIKLYVHQPHISYVRVLTHSRKSAISPVGPVISSRTLTVIFAPVSAPELSGFFALFLNEV